MTIGSRMIDDDRSIESNPSTKLLKLHIGDTLTWYNQIKHISS